MKIKQLTINSSQQQLTIIFSINNEVIEKNLTFEYLRVSSPEQTSAKKNSGSNVISHKKDVRLQNIESVAKHGYRFIFNDSHSAIYSEDYIEAIAFNFEARWQQYLAALKASGHTREAMIDIKQV